MTAPSNTQCPVCSGQDWIDTVHRERLPAMQNYVYRTRAEAQAAPSGELTLAACATCGFAWNRTYDPERLVYDTGYDNAVPSAVMAAHYRETAGYLARRYDLAGGLVVDVGCGSGTFLRELCEVAGARGLGIDPALESDRDEGRIRLVASPFAAEQLSEAPALVVSRHVLEHLPQPVDFLREIRAAVERFGEAPCFFEVPDLQWIVEHGAFQDFCYEHCNYFTDASLWTAVVEAGYVPRAMHTLFGSQYLCIEADTRDHALPHPPTLTPAELADYARAEGTRIAALRDRLLTLRDDGCALAVWGMATKGVLFVLLVDPEATLIDACVDVNANKQGAFAPLTGHRIDPPDVLRELAGKRLAVVVMNDNYRDEIAQACAGLGVDATLLSLDEARV